MITATQEVAQASVWIPGLIIFLGVLGVIIPIIPGLIIALIGVLIWAFDLGSTAGWIVFGLCVAIYAAGLTLQFLIPGKRMKAAGIETRTLLLGMLLGIVGFFALPGVGGPLGFVLGIYLIEMGQSRDRELAWRQTKVALRGVLHSIGIELLAGLAIVTTWVIGVLVTR